MLACMYCLCIYVCACIYVYMHVCIYVIFKLGFERYGGNCPSWEGELSGGIVRGNCPFPAYFVVAYIQGRSQKKFDLGFCFEFGSIFSTVLDFISKKIT